MSYHKTKTQENEQEKNDRDAIAFGTNNYSYVVEQGAMGTPKNMGGGVKVLEKKPKAKFAHAPPITPFSVNPTKKSHVKTTIKEEDQQMICQAAIVADRLGRGLELISLVNETDVPVGYATTEEKANYVLDVIRSHLEKMTEDKYVLYGFVDEKQWIFSGAENTLADFSELRLELKLVLTAPVNMQISAFSGNIKQLSDVLKKQNSPDIRKASNERHSTERSSKKKKKAVAAEKIEKLEKILKKDQTPKAQKSSSSSKNPTPPGKNGQRNEEQLHSAKGPKTGMTQIENTAGSNSGKKTKAISAKIPRVNELFSTKNK
ncbi:unnamed protein product [Caenorhabditis bovis]|uniref:Uncharacterized protein n=1 Tax=Caenorhabditis bovis TaxID=2654633 RepID=A0A8S1EVN6_9PELO|nr:unnamed protein product [Caenorhabditis bovis]